MAIGKRSKLTLGLKKKPEENNVHNEEDTIDKLPKLALGVGKNGNGNH